MLYLYIQFAVVNFSIIHINSCYQTYVQVWISFTSEYVFYWRVMDITNLQRDIGKQVLLTTMVSLQIQFRFQSFMASAS